MTERPTRIVLTGASGLVGSRLRAALRAGAPGSLWADEAVELRLISRRARPSDHESETWFRWEDLGAAVEGAAVVVHLAGEPVAGRRWTTRVRKELWASRVGTSERVVQAIEDAKERPQALIQASAVGWYGDGGDELLDEHAPPGGGLLGQLCRDWEAAAAPAEDLGLRLVYARIGLVLDTDGGALGKLIPLFRKGLGGRLGSGRQWMPWIHRDDVIFLLIAAIADDGLRGPVNVVGTQPVRNREFTQVLASVLRRPAFLPAPAFALRAAFGQGADVLLAGQRAIPAAAQARGWEPQWPELRQALGDLLH